MLSSFPFLRSKQGKLDLYLNHEFFAIFAFPFSDLSNII